MKLRPYFIRLFSAGALLILVNVSAWPQTTTDLAKQQAFQHDLLQIYQNLKGTPEEITHLKKIKRLSFFAFDSTLQVRAMLDTTQSSAFVAMKTSLGRPALYRRYGTLSFTVKGQPFSMPVYQAKSAADSNSDELFF